MLVLGPKEQRTNEHRERLRRELRPARRWRCARGVSALHRSQHPTFLDDVCPEPPPHPSHPAHVSAPTDCIYHPPPSSYILTTYLSAIVCSGRELLKHILRKLLSSLLVSKKNVKECFIFLRCYKERSDAIDTFPYLVYVVAIWCGGVDSIPVAVRCLIPTVQLKLFTSLRERPVNVICAH